MAIRPSPARDIARLLTELASADALRRESAAARLTIVGAPAAVRVAALATDPAAAAETRCAALHTLAGIDPVRALAIASDAVGHPSDVMALEAIEILAAAAHSDAADGTPAFERLTGLALDRRQPVGRRLAILTALRGLPSHLLTPIDDALERGEGHADVGDATWLEPVAGAWVAAGTGDRIWRGRMAALFAAIVAREGLTRTSPALVRVLTSHPGAAVLVAAAPRARTRSKSRAKPEV